MTVSAFVATLSGCSDNADELAAARAAKKPPSTNKNNSGQGEAVVPVSNNGPNNPVVPNPPTAGGGACTPQQVSGLQVLWRPPSPRQQVCTQQEAMAIATCFFNNQNCQTTVSAQCHHCAVSSPTTSSTYGAIIVDETGQREPEVNVEGCVATLTGDTSATGCGGRLKATYACESAACTQCTDSSQLANCQRAAAQGPCAQQAQASAQCESTASQCMSGSSEAEVAFNLIQMFCM